MSDLNRREEFRVEQIKEMTRVSGDLFGAIEEALAAGLIGQDFADYIADPLYASFVAQYGAEQLSPFALYDTPRQAWDWFYGRVRAGLEAVGAESKAQTIADWLGTAVVNGAKVSGTEATEGKMWLSRRDAKVRPFHVEADGQVVRWNEPFIVCGEIGMLFPGDAVGDPECWLNCRCVAAPAIIPPITAAGDMGSSIVVVALPEAIDPVVGASSEPGAHMTMLFFGKMNDPAKIEEIKSAVKGGVESFVASGGGPVVAPVLGREKLGDDDADVAMVDPGELRNLRDYLLTHPAIKAAYDAVEQYPQWTPHVTMGYPETPANGDPGETILFDRLAVWDDDYAGEEYPMSVAVEEAPPVEDDMPVEDEDVAYQPVPWHGVLAPEGVYTGDGRKFMPDSLTWRDLPLPLLWQEKSGMGHEGSVIVGQIANIFRENGLLIGEGTFSDTEDADKVVGLVANGDLRGVSVDVDQAEMSVEDDEKESMLFHKGRISAATMCAIPAFSEAYIAIGYRPVPEVADEEMPLVASPTGPVTGGEDVPLPFGVAEFKRGPGWLTDPVETKRIHDYWTVPGNEGYAKIKWGTPGDFRRLRAHLAKYISPVYLNRTTAQWHHDALGYWPGECGRPGNPPCGAKRGGLSSDDVLAAAANLYSVADPIDSTRFSQPILSGPTPITVTDDGWIYGHLASWGTCHIGIPGTCVEAPSSPTDYAYYRTGVVMTDKGAIPVGQITMGTGHADMGANAKVAAAHYDNTGSVVADVAAGDDDYGIWVSGLIRPGTTPEQVAAIRAGALSGDWRSIGGHLELVAALVVNVPGFPIPHTGLAASGGVQSALVAAGLVQQSGTVADVEGAVAELVTAVADEVEARSRRRARAAALLEDTKALRVASLLNDMEV